MDATALLAPGREESNEEVTSSGGFSTPVQMLLPTFHILKPLVAIILQLAVISIILVFGFTGVWFQHDGNDLQSPVSRAVRLGYTSTVTVLTTLLTSFTIGKIKTLWFLSYIKSGSTSLSTTRKTTNLLGQASLRNKIRDWPITLTMLFAGLITTAVTTGLNIQSEPCELLDKLLASSSLRHCRHSKLLGRCKSWLIRGGHDVSRCRRWSYNRPVQVDPRQRLKLKRETVVFTGMLGIQSPGDFGTTGIDPKL